MYSLKYSRRNFFFENIFNVLVFPNQFLAEDKLGHTVAPFAIYEDCEEKKFEGGSNQPSTAPFAIYQDVEEKKPEINNSRRPIASIPIFCDEENRLPINSSRKKRPVPLATIECNSANEPEVAMKPRIAEDDKENTRPVDNEQYTEYKVPTKGALLPSEQVPYAPLDVQENVLDEDEREQEMEQEQEVKLSRINSYPIDQTMALPTAEDFEEMAKMISTPMNGRRFIPEEDEFTCAIQLAFKKPLPVSQPERPASPSLGNEKENDDVYASTVRSNVVSKNGPVSNYSGKTQHNSIPKNDGTQNHEVQTQKSDNLESNHERTLPTPAPDNPMVMMSPIMETSREYNYKSSSSSSESQWQMTLANNKSHWNGNNTTSGYNLPNSNNTNNVISGVSTMTIY